MLICLTMILTLQVFFLYDFIYAFERSEPPIYGYSFGKLNLAEMYPVNVEIDDDLNIYILNNLQRRIQKRDPENNILMQFGKGGSGPGEFSDPRGFTIDPLGNLYVSDTTNNRIQKFDANGKFIAMWGTKGSMPGEFNYPVGVKIDESGKLFVADCLNSRIQVFSNDGSYLYEFGIDAGLERPEYIAFDSKKNIWVTDIKNRKVHKFDESGSLLISFGGRGTGQGQFESPTGVIVDNHDFLYVYDRWNSRIQKFDDEGNFVKMWGIFGEQDGQMHGLGLGTDKFSNIYLADYWNFRIQMFDPEGNFIKKWQGDYTKEGEFAYVKGVAVNNVNDVYVVDQYDQNVQVFDSIGNFKFQWGKRGLREWNGPYFNFPISIAIDSERKVFVSNNNDIRIFDEMGQFYSSWIVRPEGQIFSNPRGMAVGIGENIYITTSADNVVKYDNYGSYIISWGESGSNIRQFKNPTGIAVDNEGNVFVSDTSNHRIQKFDPDGNFLLTWGKYGDNDGEFLRPFGIAIDNNNDVYVVDESKNQVQKFDSDGLFLTKWGKYGKKPGEFNHPFYIAVNKSGKNIYVTDSYNGRVQMFTYEPITLEIHISSEIVQRGDNINVQVKIFNKTCLSEELLIATNVTTPDNTLYPKPPNYLYGPEQIDIEPFGFLEKSFIHEIPLQSKAGTYIYNVYLGKSKDKIIAESEVQFIIVDNK